MAELKTMAFDIRKLFYRFKFRNSGVAGFPVEREKDRGYSSKLILQSVCVISSVILILITLFVSIKAQECPETKYQCNLKAKCFSNDESKNCYGQVTFEELTEEQVADIASSTQKLIITTHNDKEVTTDSQITSYGKTIVVRADKETVCNMITMLYEIAPKVVIVEADKIRNAKKENDDKKSTKHILFEASFITVSTDKIRQINPARLDVSRGAGNARTTNTLDVNTDYGQLGSFAHKVIWTITRGMTTYDLTAGYIVENGLGTVISKPAIRVQDGGHASFTTYINVPYTSSSQFGTGTIFVKAGITLEITKAEILGNSSLSSVPCDSAQPTGTYATGKADIQCGNNDSDIIKADLVINDGGINIGSKYDNVNGQPILKITEISSSGLFNNKTTYIVASLINELDVEQKYNVPVVSRIPVLGKLFRIKNRTSDSMETIILIRPVIEDARSMKYLASQYSNKPFGANMLDRLPKSLGGFEDDSIIVHPLSGTKWRSVPEIYDQKENSLCKNPSDTCTYWELQKKYTDYEIKEMGGKFGSVVRDRLGLVLGQTDEQIADQILCDDGLGPALTSLKESLMERLNKDRVYDKRIWCDNIVACKKSTFNESTKSLDECYMCVDDKIEIEGCKACAKYNMCTAGKGFDECQKAQDLHLCLFNTDCKICGIVNKDLAPKISSWEILIAAAHTGAINQCAFRIYWDELVLKPDNTPSECPLKNSVRKRYKCSLQNSHPEKVKKAAEEDD